MTTKRIARYILMLATVSLPIIGCAGEKEAVEAATSSVEEDTPATRPANSDGESTTGTASKVDLDSITGVEESAEILARDPVTETSEVRHVLIAWAELSAAYGARMPDAAKTRTKEQADILAGQVLARAIAGEDFVGLMKAHSEDWGSAETGQSYTATPSAGLVPPFKALSLRLNVGETGVVETKYGWHVIQRVS